MTSLAELTALLRNGENSGVEFKRDDITPFDLARCLVALSNLRGGRLLLGVEDDGTVSGMVRNNAEEWMRTIAGYATTSDGSASRTPRRQTTPRPGTACCWQPRSSPRGLTARLRRWPVWRSSAAGRNGTCHSPAWTRLPIRARRRTIPRSSG